MNPIEPNLKTEFFPIALIAISILSSFYFYKNFPDQVPIHWNFAGEVDNYGTRNAAFIFPGVLLGIYLLFLSIPYLDPKKERYDQFRKTYHIFKNLILSIMTVIFFVTSFNALGYNISIQFVVPSLAGLLFIFLGNYMGKLKSNWFIGIRTPWTLSSEEVWNKTHRFGGKVFMIGGLMMAITSFLPVWLIGYVFFADIIFIVLGTVVYSYFVYNKEKSKNNSNENNN